MSRAFTSFGDRWRLWLRARKDGELEALALADFFARAFEGPLAEREAALDLANTYGHWSEAAVFARLVARG